LYFKDESIYETENIFNVLEYSIKCLVKVFCQGYINPDKYLIIKKAKSKWQTN